MKSLLSSFTVVAPLALLAACNSESGADAKGAARDGGSDSAASNTDAGADAIEEDFEASCRALQDELEVTPDEQSPARYVGLGYSETTDSLRERCVVGGDVTFTKNASAYVQAGFSSKTSLESSLGLRIRPFESVDLHENEKRAFIENIQFPTNSAVGAIISLNDVGNYQHTAWLTYSEAASAARDFEATCGDQFIRSARVGGVLYIVYVVDLTGASDNDRWDLTFSARDVFFKGQPDRTHPHTRYVFRLGGGRWSKPADQVDGAQLLRCFGVLTDQNPAPLYGTLTDYGMLGDR
jgi:hypothetical protein